MMQRMHPFSGGGWQPRVAGGGNDKPKGDRMISRDSLFQVPGLSRRVPVQEFRFRCWSRVLRPHLMPVPEPAAATCDLERFLSTNRQPLPPRGSAALGRDAMTSHLGRRRAAEGRGTIYRALLIRRARHSHAPTMVRPAANGCGSYVVTRSRPYLVMPLPLVTVSPCPRVPSLRLGRSAQISKSVPDSDSASWATVKQARDLSKRFETSRQRAAT